MVATPNIYASQAEGVAATLRETDIRLSQFDALVAFNFPTEFVRNSQFQALIAGGEDIVLHVSQAFALVAVLGRPQVPRVRAWTFTLDGHDFYVLRLGTDVTLVYDLYSEQWMDWDAFTQEYWPVTIGMNWVGGIGLTAPDGNSWGSNVLVGDDTSGIVWILDPERPYDESPEGETDPTQTYYFPRVTMGQVAIRGRENLPCYAVWLTSDMGDPAYTGAGVTLEISDDAGETFDDMGTVTITAGEARPELAWYSLGQIEAPGRLFRITDDGAIARIDGMEMNDPDDD